MNLPHSVAEILKNHVTFQLESIDRLYLNVYVPALQYEGGVVRFFSQPPGPAHRLLGSDGPNDQELGGRH